MTTIARAEPGRKQEAGASLMSLTQVLGPKALCQVMLLSQAVHKEWAEWEVEQLAQEPVSLRVLELAVGELASWAGELHPGLPMCLPACVLTSPSGVLVPSYSLGMFVKVLAPLILSVSFFEKRVFKFYQSLTLFFICQIIMQLESKDILFLGFCYLTVFADDGTKYGSTRCSVLPIFRVLFRAKATSVHFFLWLVHFPSFYCLDLQLTCKYIQKGSKNSAGVLAKENK